MSINFTRCLGVAAFATMAALPLTAHATPFGAATIGFSNATVEPTYTIGAGSGTITFNGQLDTKAATGDLLGVTAGSGHGIIGYSLTEGATVIESLLGLFTFVDPAGTAGQAFSFNATSVQTVSFSSDPNNGDSISLYVLGTIGGGKAGLTPTAADVVINLFGLGGGGTAMSTSSQLTNPPVSSPVRTGGSGPTNVPEAPSTLILLSGLASIALVKRSRPAARQ